MADANGIQNIDTQCTVKVADGVSMAVETIPQNLIANEGVEFAS